MSLDNIFHEFANAFRGRVVNKGRDVAFARSLRRNALDETLESLHDVDKYLIELHARQSEIPSAEWETTVLWGGAYVGEVIRLSAPPNTFRWIDYDEYVPLHEHLRPLLGPRSTPTCAFLMTQRGMIMPLNKVARFISQGIEHSVHFFASTELGKVETVH